MKKLAMLFVFGLMLAVLAGVSNATLTLSTPTIGSSDQQRDENASATLTLTNNETTAAAVSAITFSTVGANTLTDRVYSHTLTFSNTTPSVPASGTATLSVTGLVPVDFDGVNANLEAVSFKIGTLTVTYTGGATATADVYMQARNALDLKKVEITVNGGESTKTVSDGDTVKSLKPGDLLSIDVTGKNVYNNNDYDVAVQSITANAKVDDSNFDLDEDQDMSDLDAGSDDTVTFSDVVIDDSASGTYDLKISLYGTDENGAYMGGAMTVKLKVERDNHELDITKAQLTKPTVSCVDGVFETTDVKVGVKNIGKHDEDSASVEAVITDLNIDVTKDSLSIGKDDSATYTLSVKIPAGTKPGVYDMDVVAYALSDVETARKTLQLTVGSCAAAQTTTVTTATTATTTGTTATTGTAATATAPVAKITSTSNVPFTETSTYVYVLGGVVVVLLISTIWIGVKLAALAK